jgi:hypothetical protein
MAARHTATVKQTVETYHWLTESALRSLVFDAKAKGLDRAVIRIGRRVLIDLDEFDAWLDQHRESVA